MRPSLYEASQPGAVSFRMGPAPSQSPCCWRPTPPTCPVIFMDVDRGSGLFPFSLWTADRGVGGCRRPLGTTGALVLCHLGIWAPLVWVIDWSQEDALGPSRDQSEATVPQPSLSWQSCTHATRGRGFQGPICISTARCSVVNHTGRL